MLHIWPLYIDLLISLRGVAFLHVSNLSEASGADLSCSAFAQDGSDEGLRHRHAAARRYGAARAERANAGRLGGIRGDQSLLLGRGAGRATAALSISGARAQAESLQGRERIGRECREGRAAAAAVAVVLLLQLAGFGAGAARVGSQQY